MPTELDNQDIYDSALENERRFASASNDTTEDAKQQGLAFHDPTHVLVTFDDDIRERRVKVYPWQVQAHKRFAQRDNPDLVDRIAIVANNGSGKSRMVIAPCAIWLCMRFLEARAIVTSSSGVQLDRQVGYAITQLANKINKHFGAVLWKCNYRKLTFLPTGSTIEMFATDEAGKAEGYHSLRFGAEVVLFVDEAKSVEEKIFEAMDRYTNITRQVYISSPGAPTGRFYSVFQNPSWWTQKVTYKDCPHIKQDKVDEDIRNHGEASAWFKSAYLAEFCSVAETLVITWEQINKCIANPPPLIQEGELFAGLDLAQGGDENVLAICQGNSIIKLETFYEEDTTITADKLKNLINKYAIKPEYINADDGTAGKPIIDMLWRDGYIVNRLRNESAAFDKNTYANRGAETWYSFARIVQECDVVLPNDKTLLNQLATRYYSQGDVLGKILLESKRIARSKGHGSPDRADAVVLAFAHKRFPLYQHVVARKEPLKKQTVEEIFREINEKKYAYSGLDNVRKGISAQQEERCFGWVSNN